jgi:hypothetical protein
MLFAKKKTADDKEKKIKEQSENVVTTPAIKDEDVHVMPGKFVALAPDVKKSGAKTMTKVLVSLLFFLILVVGGAAWYILSKKNPVVVTNQNNNKNINTAVNNRVNTNTSNVNMNVNDIINSIVNNTNTTNQNTNINSNVNNVVVVPPENNQDSDQDALTLLEEALYNTNEALDDSDKDGYKDGAELLNLYDPSIAGGSLSNSSLIKVYKNDNFNYQLFVPKKWLVQSVDDGRKQINFVPDSATGETISIKVTDNTQHSELVDWQKILLPNKTVENYRLANYSAVKTSDGKQVLFVTYDYVFMISYDQASVVNANFGTSFAMMLKSFALNIKEVSN